MPIYKSQSETVGKTPLIFAARYMRACAEGGAPIFVKAEWKNPFGSSKDRAALYMLNAACLDGRLGEGSVIVEPTSGNMGISLASMAAEKGMRARIVMPDTASPERAALIRGVGAEVVLTDGALGMAGAIAAARELVAATPGAVMLSQFSNPDNLRAHYETTGPEIWEALGDRLGVFVAGVGTGGTLGGVGKFLKEKNPRIRIVAVEPAESAVLSGRPAAPHLIQGIGAGFVPPLLDMRLVDEVIAVSYSEARDAASLFARTEGRGVGISSGAALRAAAALSLRLRASDSAIAALLPDGAERYLSVNTDQ